MAFSDLTNEEQAAMNSYVREVRAAIGQLRGLRETVVRLDAAYGNIQGLLGDIDGAEIIPDGGGLAGALPLNKNEAVTLTAHLQGLLTAYGAGHFALWAKAAGINGGG
ncbi:MAG: hypothetical protein LC131_02990 [Anaerolineae bacterium]|nr:hypothetical protein [Anaerolineae bacterium]